MKKVIVSWSGGKDSALALNEIQKEPEYEIVSLLSTVTKDYGRVSMHGFKEELLEQQAQSLALPLFKIYISKDTSNDEYEKKMRQCLKYFCKKGVSSVVFGDIFLEDLRNYREKNLAKVLMKGIFPLWKINTGKLSKKFIDLGFKAIVTCVDTQVLDGEFAGRQYCTKFLKDLPANIDPCGENGEFHTFVFDGPVFVNDISFTKGAVVLREKRFKYCDLLLKTKATVLNRSF